MYNDLLNYDWWIKDVANRVLTIINYLLVVVNWLDDDDDDDDLLSLSIFIETVDLFIDGYLLTFFYKIIIIWSIE